MQSVGAGAYDQRLTRVISARGLLEDQLKQRLVLLEGYSRISSMIEIEVEMNTSVWPVTCPFNASSDCLRKAHAPWLSTIAIHFMSVRQLVPLMHPSIAVLFLLHHTRVV